MSKQRYENIQSALLQNQKDSSKNLIDKSQVQDNVNQLKNRKFCIIKVMM